MKLDMLLSITKAEGKAEGRAEGLAKGKAEGVPKGEIEAEERFSRLMTILISKGKRREALAVSTDYNLRKKLYRKYGLL